MKVYHRTDQMDFKKLFVVSTATDIKSIIKNFKADVIEFFQFQRIHKDQSFSYLGTTPNVLYDYLDTEYYKKAFSGDISCYQSMRVLYPEMGTPDWVELMEQRYRCGKGLLILRKTAEYADFFGFALVPKIKRPYSFFLNNIYLFELFVDYFYEEARELIKKSSEERLVHPTKTIETCLFGVEDSVLENDWLFEKQQLTKREIDCALLLRQGFTATQIAEQLFLSPRTIEVYIRALKQKFGCERLNHLLVRLGALMPFE